MKPVYTEHAGPGRAYIRDMILGVNDGLVSTFLLVLGVAGGGLSNSQILLIGLTNAFAGAISMGLGEFLATRSQNQMIAGEIKLEKEHLKYHREKEIAEVREVLRGFKLTGRVLEEATQLIGSDDEALLNFMMCTEFGQSELDQRLPLRAMATAGVLFFVGSLPAWVPAAFVRTGEELAVAASVLALLFLLAIGAVKGRVTRTSCLLSGLENAGIGAAGAAVCYALGRLYSGQ
eukprot:tig00000403_g327.t1